MFYYKFGKKWLLTALNGDDTISSKSGKYGLIVHSIGNNDGGKPLFKQLFGIYEKALPREWPLSKKFNVAKEVGFDYFELSTDESEAFQARMRMDRSGRLEVRRAIEEYDMPVLTMCLSGTRNCPIGSKDPELRRKGISLTLDAIHFAADIGLRIIQPMAYDNYYGERDSETYSLFIDNLGKLTDEAASCGVMLALENVDIETMDNLEKGLAIIKAIGSPWLQIYPDIANLYATGMGNEAAVGQYRLAKEHIVASHVKDTVVGTVRDIPFGKGEVDFDLFFRMIREENIHGPFTLEMWAQNYEDPVSAAKEALVFIKNKYERSLHHV